jgi:hypothetical protein
MNTTRLVSTRRSGQQNSPFLIEPVFQIWVIDKGGYLIASNISVLVTVHADAAPVENASHLRINGYLVKPISPKQLGDRLRTIFHDRLAPETEAVVP